MLDGVQIQPLKIIPNKKGEVRHMIRSDDSLLKEFGEVYFSYVLPGVIKGWKKHNRQSQNLVVPIGEIKLVLFDCREASSTKGQIQEILLGQNHYQLVHIPSEIWYSFQSQNHQLALIANCTDSIHDPTESQTMELSNHLIDYHWSVCS